MLVQHAMHTQLVTINAQQTLPEAVQLLHTLGLRRLLVLEEGRLVGLLTDGQVKRALARLGTFRSAWEFAYQVGNLKVQEMMQPEVWTARPGDDMNRRSAPCLTGMWAGCQW
ncbi:CBS domain-containing protein [Deinococcus oregonensis]|uniref:CBS domain-containing protein n=1 Tax=Deinococcus oregonensis TaxID=1805970 RepID=A0ABV6AVV3_9DEIO